VRRSLLVFALAACAHAPAAKTPEGTDRYADPKAWLCLPDREDACARNADATDLDSRAIVRDRRAPSADSVDCFYVYPTVDLRLGPANHQDFSDTEPMARATFSQAALFRSVCSLYVPLYRQVTLGTYLQRPEKKKEYTDVASADVVDAFRHWLAHYDRGKKIVLLGHSQGAEMTAVLLQRFFDHDPAMRARLLYAMPIGWAMHVPRGKTTGGTFENIPMCTRADETGCVISYRSHTAGIEPSTRYVPLLPGHETVCVNPAELAHGAGSPFSRAFFPIPKRARWMMRGVDTVETPFVMLRDFYSGKCVDGPDGYRYLAVSARDPEKSPVDLEARLFKGDLGLHILDYQFALGDLVDLVASHAQ
jgi:hypothetical protein